MFVIILPVRGYHHHHHQDCPEEHLLILILIPPRSLPRGAHIVLRGNLRFTGWMQSVAGHSISHHLIPPHDYRQCAAFGHKTVIYFALSPDPHPHQVLCRRRRYCWCWWHCSRARGGRRRVASHSRHLGRTLRRATSPCQSFTRAADRPILCFTGCDLAE